jgi:hypothetical protein
MCDILSVLIGFLPGRQRDSSKVSLKLLLFEVDNVVEYVYVELDKESLLSFPMRCTCLAGA